MKTKILLTLGLASLALTISGCDDKSTIYPSVTGQIQQEQPKYTSNTSEFDLIKKQTFYDSDANSNFSEIMNFLNFDDIKIIEVKEEISVYDTNFDLDKWWTE